MELTSLLIVSLAGYLIGAIPFAVIVSAAYGVNILQTGSGNPGATNVKRAVGRTAGNLVFVLDVLKGLVAAGWPLLAYNGDSGLAIVGLLAAIIGHSFSVFIRFRGGKGVAAAMGGLLAIAPWALAAGLVVWLLVYYASRYVSLASICFGWALPLAGWISGDRGITLFFLLLLALLITVRHRDNIKRLLAGTEHRFSRHSTKNTDR